MNGGDLPKGWRWVRLGEVAEVFSGSSAPQGQIFFEKGLYPFVRVQDLGRYGRTKNLSDTIDKINDFAIKNYRLKRAPKGTILFPKSGAAILTNNRAMLGIDAYIVSHLAAVKAIESAALADFLYYWLCYLDVRRFIENEAYPSLKLSKIKSFQIPFPPLPEQRRIVARIEELVSRIEEAKRLRHAAREETKAIMPAALCKIFSKANTQGWKKNKIAELITDIKTGTTPPSKETNYYGGNIQWFTPGDLGHSKYLSKSNRTLTATAIKAKKAKIFKEGTILFVGIGATLGKVGIAAAEVSSNQQITGLYFGPTIIPDFAYYWFRFKYDYIRLLSSAVTLPIINQDGLKNLVMEFPPLEEQRRIVTYLDRLQAKVEELRLLQEEPQKELDTMTFAILDRAFQGEL